MSRVKKRCNCPCSSQKSFGYGQKVIATVQNVFRVAVEKKLKKVYSTLTATVKPRKEVSALCGFKINHDNPSA